MLVGRNPETLALTYKNIAAVSKSIRVLAQPTNVSDEPSVKALFEKVKGDFGKAHVLVNAAGSMGGGLMGDAPLASWWGDFASAATKLGNVSRGG